MNRLERRFKIQCAKDPNYSDLVNLLHVVEYQRFPRHVITKGINSLVDKDDYEESDLESIIEHFLQRSHSPKPQKDHESMALNKDSDLDNCPA